jgi:hypothetical protein
VKTEYFVVGAAKAGTTSIYNALKEHEKFSLPNEKEPNTFNTGCSNVPGKGPGDLHATTVLRRKKECDNNFNEPINASRVDFSVSYLYDEKAPENIFEHNPGAKILIILRNPIQRAFSHYLHMIRDCRETLSFEGGLKAENKRVREGFEFSWHYKSMGLYNEQVQRYVSSFGENVVVLKFEDFFSNKENVEKILAGFFDLEEGTFKLSRERYNATGTVKNPLLAKIVNRPSAIRNLIKKLIPRETGRYLMSKLRNANLDAKKPAITPEVHNMLIEFYRKDVDLLNNTLELDFSDWLD